MANINRRSFLQNATMCAGLAGAATFGGLAPTEARAWADAHVPAESPVDLQNAVIVVPRASSPREQRAAQVLAEEVEKRTAIRWPVSDHWKAGMPAAVFVGSEERLRELSPELPQELQVTGQRLQAPESFRLQTSNGSAGDILTVSGIDERGTLFGVGELLRKLRLAKEQVVLPGPLNSTSAPKYKLRGHQLGYRPKTNSYDAWSVPMWEQYIRDLAVFGTNTIELIPPRSDDAPDSPHFPLPPMRMMVEMSRLADAYGLDVWIWYPAMDRDYSDPKTVEFALHEWAKVFEALPRVDAVYVPAGDPGHTRPKYMLPLLEKQWENLRRFHPRAQMWASPQSFDEAWTNEFLDMIGRELPALVGRRGLRPADPAGPSHAAPEDTGALSHPALS